MINKTPFFPHIYFINITRADGKPILYETHTAENAINTIGMTKIEGATIESFEEALKLLNHNTTFAWTIPENYYMWRDKLHTQVKESHSIYPWINGEVEDGCVAPYKTPDIYMTLAEQVLIDAGIHSDFATIHIRRGDVKTKRCKTTLEKIRSYAECSLKNCTKDLPVILFTDERNMTYVNGVKQIFEDIGSFLANIMIFFS